MSTNKVALRTVEEFMQGYTPVYQPIYPLFLGKSQSYSEQVGRLDFKRVDTIGDIRAKHITPKDTELRQIAIKEGTKSFKKYFLANSFQISSYQDQNGVEDVVGQVLDEHQKQMDELFLLGEGTSASTMINNGLYWSDDANYILNPDTATVTNVATLHTEVMETVARADALSGRKLLMFYGVDTLAYFDSLHSSAPVPFKQTLQQVVGSNYSLAKMPAAVTPASAEGWIIANLDQLKVHYTALPSLKDQGVNDEKSYAWFNFLMGSIMTEVLASGGVIRQDASVS